MAPPVAVLLDTDIGTDVDDAIALALLLAAPEVDLRAVTTVSGDTELRARIARKLLNLGGRPDVPVAAGIREPVLRQRSFLWLGHEGRGIVEAQDAPLSSATHGVDLFIDRVLREHPHVVAIGPLSNVAVSIMKEPQVIAALPRLTIMGGALGRAPAVPTVEYNLGSDAEAAVVVFNAGLSLTLVPLDVTWRVFFTTAELRRLRTSGSHFVQTLCDAIDIWAPIQRGFFEMRPGFDRDIVAFLHDPLTVAVQIDPSLVTMQRIALRAAIVDGAFCLREEAGAPEMDVAVDVDAPRFVDFVIDRLLRLP